MKRKSAKRNLLNLPHLPRANFKFTFQMPPLCSRERKFQNFAPIAEAKFKSHDAKRKFKPQRRFSRKDRREPAKFKISRRSFYRQARLHLFLPLFKILNLFAHPVFQLVHKRGHVVAYKLH